MIRRFEKNDINTIMQIWKNEKIYMFILLKKKKWDL